MFGRDLHAFPVPQKNETVKGGYNEQNTDRNKKVNLYYGRSRVLRDVTLDIPEKAVTALIGPSGCGKAAS